MGTPETGGIVPTCVVLCAMFLSFFGVIHENVSHIPTFVTDGVVTHVDAENDCVVGEVVFCTQVGAGVHPPPPHAV